MDNNLTTAATYLIILQNLEKPIVSRQVRLLASYCLVKVRVTGGWKCCLFIVQC